jgi:thioredoxin 1
MLIVKRYTATWCGPCKQLAPVFEELKSEMTNEASPILFQTIDVDMNKEEAMNSGISSVPTIILEKNGTQVYRFSGVMPKSVIAGIIRKHL